MCHKTFSKFVIQTNSFVGIVLSDNEEQGPF